jgi:hypothetical protein
MTDLARAPGTVRRSRARCCHRSGSTGQGDAEPARIKLTDVIAGFAVRVDAAGAAADAEVVLAAGAVGEQVPDDDQDGAGDQGLEFAAALEDRR